MNGVDRLINNLGRKIEQWERRRLFQSEQRYIDMSTPRLEEEARGSARYVKFLDNATLVGMLGLTFAFLWDSQLGEIPRILDGVSIVALHIVSGAKASNVADRVNVMARHLRYRPDTTQSWSTQEVNLAIGRPGDYYSNP